MIAETDDGIEFCEGFYKCACNKFKSQVIILTLSMQRHNLVEEINAVEDDGVGITIALKRRNKQ